MVVDREMYHKGAKEAHRIDRRDKIYRRSGRTILIQCPLVTTRLKYSTLLL